MSDAAAQLAKALGGVSAEGLDGLSDAELATLAELVVSARRRQAAALQAAAEDAFNHIPRLLRGPVRKVIGT